MESTKVKKKNPFLWLIHYVKESKEEMGKVTWPSRPDIIKYSLICIGLSVGVAAYFAGLDWLFSQGFEYLVNLTN